LTITGAEKIRAESQPSSANILVTGDVTQYLNVYLADAGGTAAKTPQARFGRSAGGAATVARLLAEVSKPVADAKGEFTAVLAERVDCPRSTVAAVWQPSAQEKEGSPEKKLWRLSRLLAVGAESDLAGFMPEPQPPGQSNVSDARIVVVEDNGGDFRHGLPLCAWPQLLEQPPDSLQWVVLRTSAPLCQGSLWLHLTRDEQLARKLVVIVPVEQFRRADVQISKGVSWERTAIDIGSELLQTPSLADLRKAAHVIVPIGADGALWMKRSQADRWQWVLIFDPHRMEGEDSNAAGGDGASQAMCCFTAAIAASLSSSKKELELQLGIERGLRAMRLALALGHGQVDDPSPGLPLKELASQIRPGGAVKKDFGKAVLPESLLSPEATEQDRLGKLAADREHWQMLLGADPSRSEHEPLYGVARRTAIYGLRALRDAPLAVFGKLTTADRGEIEALRGLKRLIGDYQQRKEDNKPLSIAVFGPPGAGKSFGIKQIAEQVLPARTPVLEFNLSQFSDEKDLIGAFHQIRDKVLEGLLPIVFWDEFDSQKLRWLQFLLAPMQDGRFQEGQLTHRIGRCIFVFAGATSFDFESFRDKRDDEDFRSKKGPDFVSRVHGYLNVIGPNRRQIRDESGRLVDDPADVCFPVRRAILLRSLLGMVGQKKDQRLEMDYGLLCAMLEVDRYTDGSRSMEKLVTALKDGGGETIVPSSLPGNDILRMNVDPAAFRAAMVRARAFQAFAPQLAPSIHETWRRHRRAESNGAAFPNDKDYVDLSPQTQAANVAAAQRMPRVLELAGLYVVPAAAQAASENGSDAWANVDPVIDILAEEEHILWMQLNLADGWKAPAGKPANDREQDEMRKQRLHECLVPFSELDAKQQERDRNIIRSYPQCARAAGFKIVSSLPRVALPRQ